MQLRDRFDDGEPDAVAVRGVRLVRLIEFAENVIDLVGRDGAAGIADHHREHLALGAHGNVQPRAHRREFYGVVKEVHPHLPQQLLVAVQKIFAHVDVQLQRLFRPFALEQQHAVAKLLGEVKARHVRQDRLIFDLGHIEHVRRHFGKAQRLVLDDVQVLRPLLRRQIVPAQQARKACDGHDGRFELVRKTIDKVRTQNLCSLQLRRHFVKAVGQLHHGRVAGKDRAEADARLKIARRQAVHGVDDAVDGAQQHAHDGKRHHAAHAHAQKHHQTDDGIQLAAIPRRAVEKAHAHQQQQKAAAEQHDGKQDRKHRAAGEQRERDAVLSLFIFPLIHTFFTAL